MKLNNFNLDNHFVLIVNFRNRFDKALQKKVCNAGPYTCLHRNNFLLFLVEKSKLREAKIATLFVVEQRNFFADHIRGYRDEYVKQFHFLSLGYKSIRMLNTFV